MRKPPKIINPRPLDPISTMGRGTPTSEITSEILGVGTANRLRNLGAAMKGNGLMIREMEKGDSFSRMVMYMRVNSSKTASKGKVDLQEIQTVWST